MSDDLVNELLNLGPDDSGFREVGVAAATALTEARAEIERLTGERDDALEQVEELERNADIVSDEFEKDCWKAMRQLLECCKFDWRDVDCGEGVTADRAYEYIKETIDAIEADGNRARDRATAAESELATLRARVREVVGPFGDLAQRYDDTVSDGWISWVEFITDHEWPTETNCRAARQLMEEVK